VWLSTLTMQRMVLSFRANEPLASLLVTRSASEEEAREVKHMANDEGRRAELANIRPELHARNINTASELKLSGR